VCICINGGVAIASATSAKPDDWVLLSSTTSGETNYAGIAEGGFSVTVSGNYPYSLTDVDHFYCTGSTETEPDWSLMFSNLCTNSWNENISGTAYINAGQTLTCRHSYYTETGEEDWGDLDTGLEATRNFDEKITTLQTYTLYPPPNNSGGGGGGGE
jgi:hypothetical protein